MFPPQRFLQLPRTLGPGRSLSRGRKFVSMSPRKSSGFGMTLRTATSPDACHLFTSLCSCRSAAATPPSSWPANSANSRKPAFYAL